MTTTQFVQTIISLYPDDGERWLRALPTLLERCADRWSLRIGAPYPLSYNYVAPATAADGAPLVLKLSPPGNPELSTEAEALELADGCGAVRLLDADLLNAGARPDRRR